MTSIVLFFVTMTLAYALLKAYKRIDKLEQENLENSLLISSTIRSLFLKEIINIDDLRSAEKNMKRDRSDFNETDFENLLYLRIEDIERKILEKQLFD